MRFVNPLTYIRQHHSYYRLFTPSVEGQLAILSKNHAVGIDQTRRLPRTAFGSITRVVKAVPQYYGE